MWLMFAAVLAVAAIAAVAGCGNGDDATSDTPDPALSGRWVLTGLAVDGTVRPLPDGVSADITFDGGRVNGRGPVNTFSGTYTSGGDGTLAFGPLARTEMAGTPRQNALEDAFFAGLEATRSFAIADGELSLRDEGGDTLLTFAAATASVVGDWTVTGYNNGREAVVSVQAGSVITADFAEDGSLSGSAGVNRYSTTYETEPASAGTLEIRVDGPIGATMMAGDEALMRQEEEFLAALASARTVTFQGSDVTLRTADDAIAVTMTPR
jgi:heat shock protein HslJ